MKWPARRKKGKFDFEDYLESMKQMRNLGGLSSIFGMLPGMGIKASDLEGAIDETQMKRMEAIVLSMTKENAVNPKILTSEKTPYCKRAGVDICNGESFYQTVRKTEEDDEAAQYGKKAAAAWVVCSAAKISVLRQIF